MSRVAKIAVTKSPLEHQLRGGVKIDREAEFRLQVDRVPLSAALPELKRLKLAGWLGRSHRLPRAIEREVVGSKLTVGWRCLKMPTIIIKAAFFATFPTGIPGIPREAVFLATFRAADDREFRVETGNPESSPGRSAHTLGKMWRCPACIVLKMDD